MATFFESSKYQFVVPASVVIITGVLFGILLLIFIGCGIGICLLNKKKKKQQGYDITDSSALQSKSENGHSQMVMIQPSQSVDAAIYANLQRRLDNSFAQIKVLEDRIDLETNAECQTYYSLPDGLAKASSRLDIIEYTIQSNQSGGAAGTAPRRQESVFSRTSRGTATTNASFRYTDMNQGQSSRSGLPPPNYQTASSSSYDRRQASFPHSTRRE